MNDSAMQLKIEFQDSAEIPEIVDFSVAWSKAHDYIDLGMFSLSKMTEFYSEKSLTARKVSLHRIKDTGLITEITRLALFFWSDNNVKGYNTHQSFISPLRKLVPMLKSSDYKSLSEVSYADVRKCFNHDWRALNFYNKLKLFCCELKSKDNWLDKDIWDISKLMQDFSRTVPSRSIRFIRFSKISNLDNRYTAKEFLLHLVMETDLSVASIINCLPVIKELCSYIKDLHLDECTRKTIVSFEEHLKNKYANRMVFNLKVMQTMKLFDWMIATGKLDRTVIYKNDTLSDQQYMYKESSVDDYVITQIFKHIDEIPKRLALWFMIIYSTGMRASEACSLERDCIYHKGEASFIRFYSYKMKKHCASVIPSELYSEIEAYRSSNECRVGEFLFQSHREGRPVQYITFRDQLRNALDAFEIVLPDGSPYCFKAHDYRHTMAVDILDSGAPFHTVQTQLHHKSARMTTAYTEFLPKRKKKMVQKIVDRHGSEMPTPQMLIQPDSDRTEWVREQLNPQILPNGLCTKPTELGFCDRHFACLECADFRTSNEYLQIHRDHLGRIEEFIKKAKSCGWEPELLKAERQSGVLRMIIDSLDNE